MSNLFWLTDVQMARLEPYSPKSHGKPRVDDLRVLSGIIFINRNGLHWCDAPAEYGPHKTLYNRWKRWSDIGVFARKIGDMNTKLHAICDSQRRQMLSRRSDRLVPFSEVVSTIIHAPMVVFLFERPLHHSRLPPDFARSRYTALGIPVTKTVG